MSEMIENKKMKTFDKLIIRLKKIEQKAQAFWWNTRLKEPGESMTHCVLSLAWDKIHDRFYMDYQITEFQKEWTEYCKANGLSVDYNFGDVLA